MRNILRLYLPLLFLTCIDAVLVWECYISPMCLDKERVDTSEDLSLFTRKSAELSRSFYHKTAEFLPSPHAELVAGMAVGYDALADLPKFKEALISTGTIHVVVVSGFNINLLYDLVFKLVGTKYQRRNFLVASTLVLLYSGICGFKPPILRAFCMAFTSNLFKLRGMPLEVLRVLWFTGLMLVLINPEIFFSVSFQLSFLATLGLTLYGKLFERIRVGKLPLDDLKTTLSAQVFVLPLISFYFGRVSLLGFLVNPLVLWSVPIVTVLGIFEFLAFLIAPGFAPIYWILSFIMLPFADFFAECIWYFSLFSQFLMTVQISLDGLLIYEFTALILGLFLYLRSARKLVKAEI